MVSVMRLVGSVGLVSLLSEGAAYVVQLQEWGCHNRGMTSCLLGGAGGYSSSQLPCVWCQETNQCISEYVGAITCPLGERFDETLPPRCQDLDGAECAALGCRGLCVLPKQIEEPDNPGQMIDGEPDYENARCVARSEPCRHPTTNAKVAPITDPMKAPCFTRRNCFSCLHFKAGLTLGTPDLEAGAPRAYKSSPDPAKGQFVCAWNTQTNTCEDRDLTIPDDAGPSAPHLTVRFAFCPPQEPNQPFPKD